MLTEIWADWWHDRAWERQAGLHMPPLQMYIYGLSHHQSMAEHAFL